jgi:prolyl oligopeptidase
MGWNKTELFLADTEERPLAFVELTNGLEHNYGVQVLDDALWISTNENAARYSLFRADMAHPGRPDWKLVLKEHPRDVLENFEVIGGQVFTSYSESAVSLLEHFDAKGASLGAIDLPSVGSNSGFSGLHDGTEALLDFESFAAPRSIHRFDLKSAKLSSLLTVQSSVAPEAFSITRRTARSKDGTSIPYVIVARKGTELSGSDHPTLLYGYGGFNLSLAPRFSRTNYAFLERGGVYVQANLRGGGEFGETWHRAGQLGKKQNVFDDFVAVAEALIDTGVTSPERLAIYGRSNGGLLVAATITQRPELFRAAVSAVPLTDMIRYPKFLIAKLWVPEYGSPENPEHFAWLYAYSPYHNVKPRSPYPATLFMTAESDTRVDPAHARKMTAALQAQNTSSHPILLRTEVEAGHGAGKPVSKVAEEYADLYAFVMSELGLPAPGGGATKR